MATNKSETTEETAKEFLERHEIKDLKVCRVRRKNKEDEVVRLSDFMEAYASQTHTGRKQKTITG